MARTSYRTGCPYESIGSAWGALANGLQSEVQEVFNSGQKHAKERRQTRFRARSTLCSLADAAGVQVNAVDDDQDFVSGPSAPLRLLTSDGRPVDCGD
jgi:hypothetical protein